MTFLINCSNLKKGGGLQVAQSVCNQLRFYKNHQFVVILSTYIDDEKIRFEENVEVYRYNIKHSFRTLLLGRDFYLDRIVVDSKVDAVLTLFGPSLWRPRVPHVCGFARAQLLLKDSPYYERINKKEKIIYKIWDWGFKRSAKVFFTENPYITEKLSEHLSKVKIYTVSNYYNQVYDHPEMWGRSIKLPAFYGITCLSVSTNSAHKNFGIAIEVIRQIRELFPGFKLRFVYTFNREELDVPQDMEDNFIFTGQVDVSEVPCLYEQADIMFMPTLLECFTASYPEAMRMEVPIVTTDLEFARGLCGDAACYYSAVDAKAAAEAIYKVATDKIYAQRLINNGKKQLLKYDNYEQRAEKLVKILEEISID